MTKSGRSRRERIASSTVARGQHGLGRAGGGDDDVGGGERGAQILPRHGAAFELPRQVLGRRQRPAGDGDLLHALRAQVDARELGHLAGAEDEDAQAGEVPEDLLGELDGGVADRDRAFGEPGFVAHALADRERGVEQPMRDGAGEVEVARRGVGRLHLAEDLRLADDERVEACRDAEEVARGVDAAMAVEVLGAGAPSSRPW